MLTTNIFSNVSRNNQRRMKMDKSIKIIDLLHEVGVATENHDEIYIKELKPLVMSLDTLYPGHKDIATMKEWIAEVEEDITKFKTYINEKNALKAEFIANGWGKDEAEQEANDMAWELIYNIKK